MYEWLKLSDGRNILSRFIYGYMKFSIGYVKNAVFPFQKAIKFDHYNLFDICGALNSSFNEHSTHTKCAK